MGDTRDTLLPPNNSDFAPATPSGLTPNTRSEAEAALTLNSSFQTESAAPTTPLPSHTDNMQPSMGDGNGSGYVDGTDEAQKAYNRPAGPIRTSSANYEQALREARKQSASSNIISPTVSADSVSILDENKVASPVTATAPFPAPGQGVVPLNPPAKGQSSTARKAKPSGMTLGLHGRQPSFKEQDIKHLYASTLMVPVKDDPGYNSGTEETK